MTKQKLEQIIKGGLILSGAAFCGYIFHGVDHSETIGQIISDVISDGWKFPLLLSAAYIGAGSIGNYFSKEKNEQLTGYNGTKNLARKYDPEKLDVVEAVYMELEGPNKGKLHGVKE